MTSNKIKLLINHQLYEKTQWCQTHISRSIYDRTAKRLLPEFKQELAENRPVTAA